MLIVTNFKRFPKQWTASSGEVGKAVSAHSTAEFCAYRNEPGALFLVNCDPRLTLALAARTLRPGPRPPLVSVDMVMRRPRGLRDRLTLPARRLLLSRVDHFIHYFRNLSGYQQVLGIGPDRSSFVPFKVNLSDHDAIQPQWDGEYVLCFGRSLRDFDTFFSAMETLPYPGAIAEPEMKEMRVHAAAFNRPLDALPPNVQRIPDDGSEAAQIRILSGAKLVVLPILKTSMVASGISTCLNAMMLGKCVIGSEGPGMTDVFTSREILTVPAEDPTALAEAIRTAWDDQALRTRTAMAGHAYAVHAGGESDLYARIIDQVVAWRTTCSQGVDPAS